MQLTDLKNELITVITKHNDLPIDAIYYVVKDVYEIVINEYNRILEQEQQANAAAQQEKTEVKEEPAAANVVIEKEKEEEK